MSDPLGSSVTHVYEVHIVWFESNLWYSGLTYFVGADPLIVKKDSDTFSQNPVGSYPMFTFQSFDLKLIDTTSASYTGTVAPSIFTFGTSSAFLVAVETDVITDKGYYRLQPESTIYDNTFACINQIFIAKGEITITIFTIEP